MTKGISRWPAHAHHGNQSHLLGGIVAVVGEVDRQLVSFVPKMDLLGDKEM